MKLGLCYMLFDGEELLNFAAKSIRTEVDHISVTYQTTSYFGNPADGNVLPLLEQLKSEGIIDEFIHYEPNLTLLPKENEVKLRNIGLQASINAGCNYHISADVDEFYQPHQLKYAKTVMEDGNYNYSVAYLANYYKDPTLLVIPDQNLLVSLIHPVTNEYNKDVEYPFFPFHMETTRRFTNPKNYKLLSRDEFTIHHMSYVRKDIRKKFRNSDNGRFYKEKFFTNYENYVPGGRVCLLPDFMNRRTTKVDNIFNIEI